MLMATGNPRETFTPRRIMKTKRLIVGALLSGSVALAGLGLGMGTANAFDPQPDPPGKPALPSIRSGIQ
jgi:hypothetical protein